MRCCFGFVLCGCRVKVLIGAIFDHTPSAEHTCRGFRRLEYHLFVETHTLDLCSQKRLAINYSPSLIVKLSSLPGSLVVLTSLSLVVHSAALSFSGLASCLLHSEALPCPRPRGLMPSTRIVSPCFARPRFQLGLSSRAPPDLTKRVRSTLSDKSWLAFITMYSTLQVLQRGHFSSYARFLRTVLLPSTRQFRSST